MAMQESAQVHSVSQADSMQRVAVCGLAVRQCPKAQNVWRELEGKQGGGGGGYPENKWVVRPGVRQARHQQAWQCLNRHTNSS